MDTLADASEAQIAAAAQENQQAVIDPEDFPLGQPACHLDGECEACQ